MKAGKTKVKPAAVKAIIKFSEPGTRFCVLVIFAASFLARLVFNVMFLGRYGLHAMGNPEVWYYLGVAGGRYRLNLLDPTGWFFRALGTFLHSDEALLIGTIGIAMILTSLAAVLIFFLVRRLHGNVAGMAAGLVYAFLGNPFELSVASFTHDFFQIPLMLLSWLILPGIFAPGPVVRRAALVLLLLILCPFGIAVGPLSLVTFAVILLYLLRRAQASVTKNGPVNPFTGEIVFAGFLLVLALLFRWFCYPNFWENLSRYAVQLRGLNIDLQKRAGSADLFPISLAGYWVQYGFVLLLVPFGFYRCLRKGDTIALANFFVSMIAGLIALRGSRAMDLSVAIFAGTVIANWEKGWFLPAIALAVLGVPYAIFHKYFPSHDLTYSLATAAVLIAFRLAHGQRRRYLVPLSVVCLFEMVVSYGKTVPGGPNIPEVEYRMMRGLREIARKGEKLMVGTWDRGYFAEVVSGLESLTSPGHIEKEANEFFWQPEVIAAVNFNRKQVSYVVISERDFKLSKVEEKKNEFKCSHAGGFIMPSPRPSYLVLQKLLVYQLLYDEKKLRYFTLLKEDKDTVNNVLIRIYRVEKVFPEKENVFLSVRILKNGAYADTFNITAELDDKNPEGKKPETRSEEFAAEEMKTVLFDHGIVPEPEKRDVSYVYHPAHGFIKGKYRNLGPRRRVKITYVFQDIDTGKEEFTTEEEADFRENETRTLTTKVDFRAQRNFTVLVRADEQLERISLQAIKPELTVLFKGVGYR